MASKTWLEHSTAWRSKAAAEGATAKRWDAYSKLSPDIQRTTSQREYAKGVSITSQHRATNVRKALEKMKQVAGPQRRMSTLIRNVNRMTLEDLRWTINASDSQIRRRAHRKSVKGYVSNPWFYRG